MFYEKTPPYHRGMKELYKRKSAHRKLTHSISSTEHERRNKEKRGIDKRPRDGRSFRNN